MHGNRENSAVALMKTVFPLAPRGWAITNEFNILEIAFVVTGDEEIKRVNKRSWLLKL